MKSTTRGTLAAVATGVAAVVGAATPAAAVGTVPVPVPLDGVEKSLHAPMPKLAVELPMLMPGAPEGPRYAGGQLLPARTLPRLPIGGSLPGAGLQAPLPKALGGFDQLRADAPASGIRALTPGLSADAPLTAPNPDAFGLPGLKLPQAGVVAPVLRGVPTANLGLGSGR
ncbi:hypothetical protein ACJ6WF_13775 [Streptomyces sp. MMS24-I2-30]|uniref:hypothetical protein n=1 Tax=Streptomyces sp. MMS24-I2-30 TaxID=3351564 RepID=UPI003896C269